jgi:hypothetical protein
MLVLKTKTTRNQAGTEVYVEFLNATGEYDVTTNPGGFGDPNPARNTLAVLFYGNFKLSSGDVVATPLTYDPLTVSSFTLAMERSLNSHMNHYIFALPIFDDEVTYEEGDVVWNNTNPLAPVVQKMNSDDEWEEVALVDLIEDEEVSQKESNNFITPDAEAFVNELLGAKLIKLRNFINEECGEDEYKDLDTKFDYVDSLLEAAGLDFCSGAYAEAQLKLEEIFSFEDDYRAAA